jgi:hypothetical protein
MAETRAAQLLLAPTTSEIPAVKLAGAPKYNPNDPTRSGPAWRWYCDRRVARTMAVLARAHSGYRAPGEGARVLVQPKGLPWGRAGPARR